MNKPNLCAIILLLLMFSCTRNAENILKDVQISLDSNRISMAIEDLNIILDKFPNDSLAAEAQYKLSIIFNEWENDPKRGYESLELTTLNYPNTKYANLARKKIKNYPDWLFNKAESLRKKKLLKESVVFLSYLLENFGNHNLCSKSQYLMGDIYMNDLRDFETALSQYRKVIKKYPGSNQEPHAQFMIGYIYANIIKDYTLAKREYLLFLSKHENHELSPSVKFEIEFLGKDINEIPALKKIAS